jgi:hypothetical protein
MFKCIISTSIPSEWAPALCNADETGLNDCARRELTQWLGENGLTGAEVFDFGAENSGFIRCAVYVDSTDARPEVSKYLSEYDCEAWLNLRIAGDYPARWNSAVELARELLENASDLDAPFLQAVIDSETGEV